MENDTLLSVEQVAKWLNVGKSTVRKLEREGKITASKIGFQLRFDPEEIRRYIKDTKRKRDDNGKNRIN